MSIVKLTEANINDKVYIKTDDDFICEGKLVSIGDNNYEIKDDCGNISRIFEFEIQEISLQNSSDKIIVEESKNNLVKNSIISEKEHPVFGKLNRNCTEMKFNEITLDNIDISEFSDNYTCSYVYFEQRNGLYERLVSLLQLRESNTDWTGFKEVVGVSSYSDMTTGSKFRFLTISAAGISFLLDLSNQEDAAASVRIIYPELVALLEQSSTLKVVCGGANLAEFVLGTLDIDMGSSFVDLQMLHYGLHNLRMAENLTAPTSYHRLVSTLCATEFPRHLVSHSNGVSMDVIKKKLAFNGHFLVPMFQRMLVRLLEPVFSVSRRVCTSSEAVLAEGSVGGGGGSSYYEKLPRSLQFWSYRESAAVLGARQQLGIQAKDEAGSGGVDVDRLRMQVVEQRDRELGRVEGGGYCEEISSDEENEDGCMNRWLQDIQSNAHLRKRGYGNSQSDEGQPVSAVCNQPVHTHSPTSAVTISGQSQTSVPVIANIQPSHDTLQIEHTLNGHCHSQSDEKPTVIGQEHTKTTHLLHNDDIPESIKDNVFSSPQSRVDCLSISGESDDSNFVLISSKRPSQPMHAPQTQKSTAIAYNNFAKSDQSKRRSNMIGENQTNHCESLQNGHVVEPLSFMGQDRIADPSPCGVRTQFKSPRLLDGGSSLSPISVHSSPMATPVTTTPRPDTGRRAVVDYTDLDLSGIQRARSDSSSSSDLYLLEPMIHGRNWRRATATQPPKSSEKSCSPPATGIGRGRGKVSARSRPLQPSVGKCTSSVSSVRIRTTPVSSSVNDGALVSSTPINEQHRKFEEVVIIDDDEESQSGFLCHNVADNHRLDSDSSLSSPAPDQSVVTSSRPVIARGIATARHRHPSPSSLVQEKLPKDKALEHVTHQRTQLRREELPTLVPSPPYARSIGRGRGRTRPANRSSDTSNSEQQQPSPGQPEARAANGHVTTADVELPPRVSASGAALSYLCNHAGTDRGSSGNMSSNGDKNSRAGIMRHSRPCTNTSDRLTPQSQPLVLEDVIGYCEYRWQRPASSPLKPVESLMSRFESATSPLAGAASRLPITDTNMDPDAACLAGEYDPRGRDKLLDQLYEEFGL